MHGHASFLFHLVCLVIVHMNINIAAGATVADDSLLDSNDAPSDSDLLGHYSDGAVNENSYNRSMGPHDVEARHKRAILRPFGTSARCLQRGQIYAGVGCPCRRLGQPCVAGTICLRGVCVSCTACNLRPQLVQTTAGLIRRRLPNPNVVIQAHRIGPLSVCRQPPRTAFIPRKYQIVTTTGPLCGVLSCVATPVTSFILRQLNSFPNIRIIDVPLTTYPLQSAIDSQGYLNFTYFPRLGTASPRGGNLLLGQKWNITCNDLYFDSVCRKYVTKPLGVAEFYLSYDSRRLQNAASGTVGPICRESDSRATPLSAQFEADLDFVSDFRTNKLDAQWEPSPDDKTAQDGSSSSTVSLPPWLANMTTELQHLLTGPIDISSGRLDTAQGSFGLFGGVEDANDLELSQLP